MKKFYSLVLMAAALLVGTNAWAGDITVTFHGPSVASHTQDYDDLQAAIDAVAPGDSATMVLNAPIVLETYGILIPHLTKNDTTGGVRILNRKAQRICIDLNNKSIKCGTDNPYSCFALMKGVLRLTGTGTVERANKAHLDNWSRGAIVVSGIDGNKNDVSQDRSKQTWSRLYVDKDVTVKSIYANTHAVGIQDLGNTAPAWNGFTKDMAGYTTKYDKNGPMWSPKADADQWSAFGVELFIEGTLYGHTRGINVLGNINQAPEHVEGVTARKYNTYPYYDHIYPYIYIGSTADVSCISNGITSNGNGGIYLGGWAIVDVHGAVYGQTGIFMKSGDVKLIDGSVYSTAEGQSSISGDYHGDVSGSGIFIASAGGAYVGSQSVAVTGDSYVAGAGGSAIVDVLATTVDSSYVSHVTITGGTIEGGNDGAINLTTGTKTNTEVTGGNVEGNVTVEGNTVNVSTLVPNTGDYHTTVVQNEEGNNVVVISQGAAPTVANNVSDATGSVKWQNTTVTNDTIKADKVLNELEISEDYAQTLVINAGKKLTVGRVVLGANAQIIVEAGAKLIVNGTQGIVAPVTSNLILRTQEGNPSIFMFHPSVTSNRHPKATVEFISKSYRKSASDLAWQRFGIPTYEQLDTIYAKYNNTEVPTVFAAFDYENDKWVNFGFIHTAGQTMDYTKMANSFDYYQMLSNTPNQGTVVTMMGKLVGNEIPALDVRANFWNGYANSCMAPMSVSELLDAIPNTVDKAIYLYNIDANQATWEPATYLQLEAELLPLQPFLIRNTKEAATVNVDYAEAVYNSTLANYAPRRRAISNDMTRVNIIVKGEGSKDRIIVAESDEFTADFDNGYDAAKYMNDGINLYVSANEKMSNYATDDLENTYVGFQAVKAGNYTIEFANVNGEELTLVDLETGARVAMTEGNTYEFTANEANDYRFQITKISKVATDIENTEAVKSATGIYTITGQYMGEMNVWNTLPAGVYVVNGEKRVK